MRNSANVLLAAAAVAFGPAAYATDTTVESLTKLEAETAVLKAKARKLEVQAQIASREAEIAKLTLPAVYGDPTVRSVEGVGRQTYATLQLDNGSAMDVKVGDALPSGAKVTSIGPNEVIVQKRDKRHYRLATTPVPQAQTGALPGTLPMLPPMSMPMPGKGVPR
jgi:hypothetical protein